MALGAVLISFSLAVLGVSLIGASHGFGALEAILIYAGLGTLALIGFALIMAAIRSDDAR